MDCHWQQASSGGSFVPEECDLASLASVRSFADRWHSRGERLDVLVCNAGVQFSGGASLGWGFSQVGLLSYIKGQ